MPTCKLCGEERPLVDAHIVPKAFWTMPQGGEDPPRLMSNAAGVRPKRLRKGVYDRTILCAKCDGSLGKLDQHAAEVLLQSPTKTIRDPFGKPLAREYTSADPARISHFVASVTWRASVSSHPVYHRVRLGPYEEKIRQALLGNGALEQQVEVFLGEFDQDDVPPLDPHFSRFDAVRFWLIYAKRFVFYCKVDQRPAPKFLSIYGLVDGKPVRTAVRQWACSKERAVMQKIAVANPNAFKR